MTYSSYLLQFPIKASIILGFTIFGCLIRCTTSTFFATYLATTLLALYFTYRYFEGPAQSLLRGFFLRPRAAAPEIVLGATK